MAAAKNIDIEAAHRKKYYTAQDSLNQILEGRDEAYANIITSVCTNKCVSDELKSEYPVLRDTAVATAVERAILTAF